MHLKLDKIIAAAVIPVIFGTLLFKDSFMPSPVQQPNYKSNENYTLQIELYDIYKIQQADIVMLGDSRTHGANWNELLGRTSVIERGITMDILEGMAARMNYIYKLKPKICFINGGINDVFAWVPVDKIFQTYTAVIMGLKARNIIPVIQSCMFAAKDYGKAWKATPEIIKGRNNDLESLNKMLADYAKKNNIDYIEINSKLITSDNYLRPELTWDGLHFRAAAYKIWADEVDKILRKYKL